jgi:transcriptional regulator with XRE-family HTH domain
MAPTLGAVLRQAREVRGFTASQAARGAGISQAYLNKLENEGVKRPSPMVLRRLGEALAVPYADLMALVGYHVPGVEEPDGARLGAALLADLTDDERDELLEYLAWYRARKRSRRRNGGSSGEEG